MRQMKKNFERGSTFSIDIPTPLRYAVDSQTKLNIGLIQSSGGTGPMKLRQPLRKQNGANSGR